MKTLILLFISGIFSLFGGIFGMRKILPYFAVIALATGISYLVYDSNYGSENLQFMLLFDHYSYLFTGIILGVTLLVTLMSLKGLSYNPGSLGDMIGLIFFILCGAICMISYNNMVMLFLGIEILSIPLYVLVGSNKRNLYSNESALKYFLMGAFATGFLLFGIALIYGATRSFDLDLIRSMSETALNANPVWVNMGLLFITIAFAFKLAAVPFHYWSPDVYQGSPTLVTAFMATVVKTAGIAAFLKFVIYLSPMLGDSWHLILSIISACTMLFANIVALKQTDFKRMLAYSSISHVGYILMAFLNLNAETVSVVGFYLIIYSLATIGIFAALLLLNPDHNSDNGFDLFKGLSKRSPLLAAIISICLLSLAGIPPFPGFFAKYAVFKQTIENDLWLLILAIISSAISIYYYFRAITLMYFTAEEEATSPMPDKNIAGYMVIGFSVIAILVLSLIPGILNF
ncbi:MAG: NADH-quinone oxidoreductase subunit N [Flavobacteriales bacterium]|nr:NADH-quinone oxidoreductase subunit N [Flavobacteriales bacterium]